MKRIFYRIANAVSIGYMCLKKPEVFQEDNFKMLVDLHTLIIKVATEKRHMMTKLCMVHPTEGEKEIVSIWAGAGLDSDPTKRISELLKEISLLKHELSISISNKQES